MEEEAIPISLPVADALLSAWVDFLTISIHTLLYHRGLYPRRTFLTARAFGAVVHQSRHPAVISWVASATDAVKSQIRAGAVERVSLVLYAPPPSALDTVHKPSLHNPTPTKAQYKSTSYQPSHKTAGAQTPPPVAERWVFNTGMFPIFPVSALPADTPDLVPGPAGGGNGDSAASDKHETIPGAASAQVNWVDVDEQLRGAIQRISHAAEKIQPLGEGATFTIAVEMRDDASAPLHHPQPWVPSEPTAQASGSQQDNTTTPIRTVTAGPLFFECWVEQTTT
ncbi:DNA polymerase zeta processivity subunit [Ceratocystis fimbriata CBS 114723]|uniref:DNA polymerase zeta processivity subunit n=1 Tax=Ceratocystis fimbriata CBS 114723 TaxID=1035309 RepID=A0A2C5WUT5_9PEZI|nr:DNA polymerase zeta processivity subunit [Ceratocystis fimbriata CBS 114723]